MNTINTKHSLRITLLSSVLCALVLLSGCDDDDNNDTNTTDTTTNTNNNTPDRRSFSVEVINNTAHQPFSPLALIAHKSGYHAWIDGEVASVGLEQLAEGGDNSSLINTAQANAAHLHSESSTQALPPGASQQFQFSLDDATNVHLTLVSMLVNTNDAYTGLNAKAISALAVGEHLRMNMPAWDAGTEANNEAAGTIPGPADGGEGFNTARDDGVNVVTIHRGVISRDDGLTTSVLDNSHRFDNPVAAVTITRTE